LAHGHKCALVTYVRAALSAFSLLWSRGRSDDYNF